MSSTSTSTSAPTAMGLAGGHGWGRNPVKASISEMTRWAFGAAASLSAARPPDEPLALGDGERAGRLREAADAHLALLIEDPP